MLNIGSNKHFNPIKDPSINKKIRVHLRTFKMCDFLLSNLPVWLCLMAANRWTTILSLLVQKNNVEYSIDNNKLDFILECLFVGVVAVLSSGCWRSALNHTEPTTFSSAAVASLFTICCILSDTSKAYLSVALLLECVSNNPKLFKIRPKPEGHRCITVQCYQDRWSSSCCRNDS